MESGVQTLLEVQAQRRNLERKLARAYETSVEVDRLTRKLARAYKTEEEARASFARRIQSKAEAEDRLARMQKHEPGVSFLGYQSPARRRIEAMRRSIYEHDKAARVAEQRKKLAIEEVRETRFRLRQIRPDTRDLESVLARLRKSEAERLEALREAGIDEAVMRNQVTPEQARYMRAALRQRQTGFQTREITR